MYVMGDVHGQYAKVVTVLQGAGLIDQRLAWNGGTNHLWFLGDFVDRGPDGLGVIDLVMRLQGEAAQDGGVVGALLGNHEPLLLAARLFADHPAGGPGGTFLRDWELNGGIAGDLAGLTDRHIEWLVGLRHMVHLDGRLFVHADALFYCRYGQTADEVNAAMGRVLQSDDPAVWDQLLGDFSERNAFLDGGADAARKFLATYGGRQIVHGHTPIHRMAGQRADEVRAPYVYADGLCINFDGGMNSGGPGFVGWLEP
ncbi:MAG TPA: metallophosphoesterase [Symbiobacteriaceae bacterium]|nr:metallophosphoesterase [Symbiobacteriaceae bacterium]